MSKTTNQPDVDTAINLAVAALYFNDGSDYEGALWDIINALNPELYMDACRDIRKVFDERHPDIVRER